MRAGSPFCGLGLATFRAQDGSQSVSQDETKGWEMQTIQRIIKKTAARRILRLVLAALFSLSSIPTLAAVPRSLASYSSVRSQTFVVRSQEGKELDLTYIRNLTQIARAELRMSVADFVPANLSESDSELEVARQIIGHSLEKWLSSAEIANGALGEAVRAVDQPLSGSVAVKSDSGVVHKVSMNVTAARSIASVSYSGWVDATVAYQISSQTLGVEVSREIGSNQKVVFNHTDHPDETRDIIGLQMSW